MDSTAKPSNAYHVWNTEVKCDECQTTVGHLISVEGE